MTVRMGIEYCTETDQVLTTMCDARSVDARLAAAVIDNARWCHLVCSTQGIAGRFERHRNLGFVGGDNQFPGNVNTWRQSFHRQRDRSLEPAGPRDFHRQRGLLPDGNAGPLRCGFQREVFRPPLNREPVHGIAPSSRYPI
jgi:hypothetical protein